MDKDSKLIFEAYDGQFDEAIGRKKSFGDTRYAYTPGDADTAERKAANKDPRHKHHFLFSIMDAVKHIEDDQEKEVAIDKISHLVMGSIERSLDNDFTASLDDFKIAVGKLIRAAIFKVLPDQPTPKRYREDLGFVKRDEYAARGFVLFLASKEIDLIDLKKTEGGTTVVKPEPNPTKRQMGVSRAKDKIKTAASAPTPSKQYDGGKVGFSVVDHYMIEKELRSRSPQAKAAHEAFIQEIGAGFDSATGTQLRRIAATACDSLEKGDSAIRELLKNGDVFLKDAPDEENEEKMPDIGDDSFSDHRYAASDYADRHFGSTPGGMGAGSFDD